MHIEVHVKPRAKKTAILSHKDGVYTVAITEAPEDNKANIALVKFFKKHFNTNVRIITGKNTKKKILKLD